MIANKEEIMILFLPRGYLSVKNVHGKSADVVSNNLMLHFVSSSVSYKKKKKKNQPIPNFIFSFSFFLSVSNNGFRTINLNYQSFHLTYGSFCRSFIIAMKVPSGEQFLLERINKKFEQVLRSRKCKSRSISIHPGDNERGTISCVQPPPRNRGAAVNSPHHEQCAQPSFRGGSIYFLIRCFAKLIALRCPSYCRVDEQKVLFDVFARARTKSHCTGWNGSKDTRHSS